MKFSCYLQLDTRRQKASGQFPVVLRITVNRKTTTLSTNVDIFRNEWNKSQLKIKGSAKSISNTQRVNKILKHYQSTAENVLYELSQSKESVKYSLTDIKELIKQDLHGTTSSILLSNLIQQRIDTLIKEHRYGHARTFEELRRFLVNYRGTADIEVTSIDYNWLATLESDYRAKGNSPNGLSVRFRSLRSLINHHKKAGALPEDFNPFKNFTIKHEQTKKRALHKEDFDKIVNADVSNFTVPMIQARKYFLISYYLLGISFYDMAQLRLGSIINDKISYRRAKTKRLYSVKISKPLKELLEEFLTGKSNDDYILPIAQKGLSPSAQARRIKNSISRYNKQLKKIANHLGIKSQMMSSYVSRHSLATHARDVSKIDIPVISQMLGHNDVATTAIYLASIEDSVLDAAVDKMFEAS